MRSNRERDLRQAAEAAVPPGDPSFVAATALPFLKARQDRFHARLAERSDRFSQLLARNLTSGFRGDRLVARSALTDEEHAEMLQLAPAAAEALRNEHAQLVAELRRILGTLDPLATVAKLTFVHLRTPSGSYYEPAHDGSEVSVEIVASLYATQTGGTTMPTGGTIEELDRLALAIQDVGLLRTFAMSSEGTDQDRLRFLASAQWVQIRGEAYEHHGRDLALAIFGPIGSWMRSDLGFTVDQFYRVADAITALVEDSVNGFLAAQVEALNEIGITHAGPTEEQRGELLLLLSRMGDGLTDSLILDPNRIASVGEIDLETVLAFLTRLSVGVGSLPESEYSGPFDATPLFRRPFLKHNELFVLPVVGHLLRSPHELFEGELLQHRPRFSAHRARVVDEIAVGLLRDALPGAEAHTNLFYEFDDGEGLRRYETDGLVLFENYCLVIEGKAGAMSVAARRGDITRLERDLTRGLSDGWQQCARVQRYLMQSDEAVFTDEHGVVLTTVSAAAKTILFVNPMLHSLGAYAHQLPALRALGLFPEDSVPWPVLVTDLRVIVEMIDSPAMLIHFMEWRASLPIGDRMEVVDELDIFGAYLFGLVGRTSLRDNEHLIFGTGTTDFDSYYASELGKAPPTKRPHRVLGEMFEQHLLDLANSRPPRWMVQSFAILDLPLTEAAAITGWLQTPAYCTPGPAGWRAEEIGDSVVVAIREDVGYLEVALEIAASLPPAKRHFVARLGSLGPRLIRCERRTPLPNVVDTTRLG